jgi:hypothetical protein
VGGGEKYRVVDIEEDREEQQGKWRWARKSKRGG